MKLRLIIILITCRILVPCKEASGQLITEYKLQKFPKTTLSLNIDSTFEFWSIKPNPYLIPVDHPDEYYFITKGRWKSTSTEHIILISSPDTILLFNTSSTKMNSNNFSKVSRFTFYDKYGDTVPILYVRYSDTTIATDMKKTMLSYQDDLTKLAYLEFHFYGYKPVLIKGDSRNADYSIKLQPEVRPNYFRNEKFKISNNTLVNENTKVIFEKVADNKIANTPK